MSILSFIRRSRIPATLEEAMAYQAELFIESLKEEREDAGWQLDYSHDSLRVIDGILEEFRSANLIVDDRTCIMISAYVYETARLQFGGKYIKSTKERNGVLRDNYSLLIGVYMRQFRYKVMKAILLRSTSPRQGSIYSLHENVRRRIEQGGRGHKGQELGAMSEIVNE